MAFTDSNKPDDIHNLDDVNSRLYRRDLSDRKPRRFDSMHPRRFSVKTEWTEPEVLPTKMKKQKIPPSFFKKFFYYCLGFAGLAIIVALVTIFTGGNTVSNTNIDINVLGNSFAAGGEELPLQVEVVNKNTSELQLADLFIEYDKGSDASGGSTHVRDLNSLGTIPAGKTVTKSFFVTLYGAENSVQNIDFTLQYRLAGSNAIFVKTMTFPVTISSSPVNLSVDGPTSVTPNQKISFTVKTKSNSPNTLSGMLLHVDYPSGFNFESATPAPDSFTNVWKLGDLAPGAERDIVITGTVYGQDGEDRAFHVYAGAMSAADNTKIGVTYNSLLQTVSLVKPFISTHMFVDGNDAATVPVASGSTVNVTVNYANNLPTLVTNAQVTLKIGGNAIDMSSITPEKGFYDSTSQSIIWNPTTDPDLASLEPSDQGTLNFTFRTLPLWSGGQIISNPTVTLASSISGKQPDQGGMVNTVTDSEQQTVVVSSDLGFSSAAFYTSGPFSNTGPIPPRANQPTTYTVTWTVTNSANALSDGVATATLPPYVDWVGTVSPSTEDVEYDTTTSTITWKIGQVAAGTGPAGAARSVSFQVRLNPSTSQVNSIPKLVLDVAVSARDTFTGETLNAAIPPTSTYLQNDTGFPAGGETVTN